MKNLIVVYTININSKKSCSRMFKKINYERSFGYKDLRLPCSSASLTSMCNAVQSYLVRYKQDIKESLPNALTIKFTSTYFLKSINLYFLCM